MTCSLCRGSGLLLFPFACPESQNAQEQACFLGKINAFLFAELGELSAADMRWMLLKHTFIFVSCNRRNIPWALWQASIQLYDVQYVFLIFSTANLYC